MKTNENTPPSNEMATMQDKNKFVLPYMTPDELDDFVTFILQSGYTVYQYGSAHDSFRKSIYLSFKSHSKAK